MKSAPRIWQQTLEQALQELGFEKSSVDPGVWYNQETDMRLWVYVDDIVATGDNEVLLDEFYSNLGKRFKAKNLGKPKCVLGIQVEYLDSGIFLHRATYCEKITKDCPNFSRVPMTHKLEVTNLMEESLGTRLDSRSTTYTGKS